MDDGANGAEVATRPSSLEISDLKELRAALASRRQAMSAALAAHKRLAEWDRRAVVARTRLEEQREAAAVEAKIEAEADGVMDDIAVADADAAESDIHRNEEETEAQGESESEPSEEAQGDVSARRRASPPTSRPPSSHPTRSTTRAASGAASNVAAPGAPGSSAADDVGAAAAANTPRTSPSAAAPVPRVFAFASPSAPPAPAPSPSLPFPPAPFPAAGAARQSLTRARRKAAQAIGASSAASLGLSGAWTRLCDKREGDEGLDAFRLLLRSGAFRGWACGLRGDSRGLGEDVGAKRGREEGAEEPRQRQRGDENGRGASPLSSVPPEHCVSSPFVSELASDVWKSIIRSPGDGAAGALDAAQALEAASARGAGGEGRGHPACAGRAGSSSRPDGVPLPASLLDNAFFGKLHRASEALEAAGVAPGLAAQLVHRDGRPPTGAGRSDGARAVWPGGPVAGRWGASGRGGVRGPGASGASVGVSPPPSVPALALTTAAVVLSRISDSRQVSRRSRASRGLVAAALAARHDPLAPWLEGALGAVARAAAAEDEGGKEGERWEHGDGCSRCGDVAPGSGDSSRSLSTVYLIPGRSDPICVLPAPTSLSGDAGASPARQRPRPRSSRDRWRPQTFPPPLPQVACPPWASPEAVAAALSRLPRSRALSAARLATALALVSRVVSPAFAEAYLDADALAACAGAVGYEGLDAAAAAAALCRTGLLSRGRELVASARGAHRAIKKEPERTARGSAAAAAAAAAAVATAAAGGAEETRAATSATEADAKAAFAWRPQTEAGSSGTGSAGVIPAARNARDPDAPASGRRRVSASPPEPEAPATHSIEDVGRVLAALDAALRALSASAASLELLRAFLECTRRVQHGIEAMTAEAQAVKSLATRLEIDYAAATGETYRL